MNPNDGGPAYPTDGGPGSFGMSLRDVIAIAAMQGLLANDPRCMEFSEIPRLSYEYADVMLIVRAKENGA